MSSTGYPTPSSSLPATTSGRTVGQRALSNRSRNSGKVRDLFFGDPSSSLGGEQLPLVSQSLDDGFVEFPENARWTRDGVVFATMHLVGSGNGGLDTPGNSDAGQAESERRLRAAVVWLREAFGAARSTGAEAVVLAFHANPALRRS